MQQVLLLQKSLRIRQHVNPFKPALQTLPEPVDWSSIYSDPQKPLIIDIGCATGRWLLLLARDCGLDCNFLGLDIRKPVSIMSIWQTLHGRLPICWVCVSLLLRSARHAVMPVLRPGCS